ncbi:hypothetical protein, partial [Rhodoplanes sp. SY1]|uniref:hypothetical protein n=1 Tax=Rhodoplanes sp. SY1 TaxID=3166646 RepID=UPI0038B4BB53
MPGRTEIGHVRDRFAAPEIEQAAIDQRPDRSPIVDLAAPRVGEAGAGLVQPASTASRVGIGQGDALPPGELHRRVLGTTVTTVPAATTNVTRPVTIR